VRAQSAEHRTVVVFFMTYWLMPRLTRWLAPWIYPKP
jgi:antibiotic biosynthesis monooxygenase (ABM) superfamily enzyme